MQDIAKLVLTLGGVLVVIGLLLLAFNRVPFLGKLPGDIRVEGKYGTFFFPLVSCLIVSALLTLLVNLFFRR